MLKSLRKHPWPKVFHFTKKKLPVYSSWKFARYFSGHQYTVAFKCKHFFIISFLTRETALKEFTLQWGVNKTWNCLVDITNRSYPLWTTLASIQQNSCSEIFFKISIFANSKACKSRKLNSNTGIFLTIFRSFWSKGCF